MGEKKTKNGDTYNLSMEVRRDTGLVDGVRVGITMDSGLGM